MAISRRLEKITTKYFDKEDKDFSIKCIYVEESNGLCNLASIYELTPKNNILFKPTTVTFDYPMPSIGIFPITNQMLCQIKYGESKRIQTLKCSPEEVSILVSLLKDNDFKQFREKLEKIEVDNNYIPLNTKNDDDSDTETEVFEVPRRVVRLL